MFKVYTISDWLSKPQSEHIAFYAGKIGDKNPNLEWPHRRSFYSVSWYTEGSGYRVIDFNKHRILNQRLFLINPQSIISEPVSSGCKGYTVMFDQSLAAHLNIDLTRPYIEIDGCYSEVLKIISERLIAEYDVNNKDSEARIKITLQYTYSLLLDKLQDTFPDADPTKKTFMKFRNLILKSECRFSSIDDFSGMLHVPTATLNSICQNFTGTSAKQFLMESKIMEAKRLLLYSKMNVNEISYQLGFEDPSYFTRIFKKKAMLCPTTFVEKYRK